MCLDTQGRKVVVSLRLRINRIQEKIVFGVGWISKKGMAGLDVKDIYSLEGGMAGRFLSSGGCGSVQGSRVANGAGSASSSLSSCSRRCCGSVNVLFSSSQPTSPTSRSMVQQVDVSREVGGEVMEKSKVVSVQEWRELQEGLRQAVVLDLSNHGCQYFSASSVVHLSFPSTLLRRPNFQFDKLMRTLNDETRDSLLAQLETCDGILILDDGSSYWSSCMQSTVAVIRKLILYLEEQGEIAEKPVFLLQNGVKAFEEQHHFAVPKGTKEVMRCGGSSSSSGGRSAEGNDGSVEINGSARDDRGRPKITLKLCIPEQQPASLASSSKGYRGCGTSAELFIQSMKGDTFHYSPGTLVKYFKYRTPNKLPSEVPAWLRPFNSNNSDILQEILAKFRLLEKLEIKRLQKCLSSVTPGGGCLKVAKHKSTSLYSLKQFQKQFILSSRRSDASHQQHQHHQQHLPLDDCDEFDDSGENKNADSYTAEIDSSKLKRDIHEELNDDENKEIVNKLLARDPSCVPEADEGQETPLDKYVITKGINSFTKNRYSNIIPYEHTRVRLEPSPIWNEPYSRQVPSQSSLSLQTTPPPLTSQGNSYIINSKNKNKNKNTNDPIEHLKVSATSSYFTKRTEFPTNKFTSLAGSSSSSPHEPFNDYFNANYLNLPEINNKCKYVATQAPLLSTIDDFWKVVTSNNVKVIVSLNSDDELNLRKWDIYWKSDSIQKYDITVLNHFENVCGLDGAVIRVFELRRRSKLLTDSADMNRNNMKTHLVYQLQYKKWLDSCGIVMSDFIKLYNIKNSLLNNPKTFIQKLLKGEQDPQHIVDMNQSIFCDSEPPSPLLVHCSAGCGRTGVFITLDFLLNIFQPPLEKYNKIDVWNMTEDLLFIVVNELRKQRISMVQNLTQYITCYESLLEFFSLRESHKMKS
ncbi:tyrosine protein phosphatase PTP2 Ecym_8308 [Eremothecium cymbalariae DBVPG|uniref:Tyrosine specific protein phosphatases domain-containing protein n=1 Tax=Eremothecium cymbalariae (strain CBS 270.75 / DBVPG 7215 / KCTC 17166 / NRRL Y-17582) TaxID=931890 RepID=G8JXL2_ERECY|nr:Hypothetical protein Ecym_8308 [Eremothecium cymbalariae DBVPG\